MKKEILNVENLTVQFDSEQGWVTAVSDHAMERCSRQEPQAM